MLVLVAGLSAADLWTSRSRALVQARARAGNLSFVLSEYVRRTFSAADASLRQIAIQSRRVGGPSAPAADWAPILAAARAALPGIGSLTITDAEGIIRQSTQAAILGQSRRDDYVFSRLSAHPADTLVISTPFLTSPTSRQRQRYLMPLGRRLTNAEGAFEGIAVATLIPEEHRGFFKTVEVGREGIVWILHPDGVIVFREPSTTDPIGQPATDNPILAAAAQVGSSGVIEAPLQPGGPRYISGFAPMDDPPLVVAVSLSQGEVLADWQRQRRVSLIALMSLGVTLSLTVFVLFRQIDATSRAQHALDQVQRAEAIKLQQSNERLVSALESEQVARRETEAASYVKDQFLMMVSHELRTPLNAIYGWARMLATGRVEERNRDRALAAIERNAKVQTRLIDDLLDVSHVISGKLRLDMRRVSIADVVSAAIDTVGPAVTAKGIRLETSIDPHAGEISADPERLQQVVWNLLSNAVKFTPERGTVQLSVTRASQHVEIVVCDSGIGVSPEFLPYVFDRFRQEDVGTKRRYGGLGLGLAIVRHLVELHGGSVAAESDGEGRGSTFRVVLPLRAAPPKTSAVAGALHEPSDGRSLDGVRVLVVDDEEEARELFASILGGAGASVVTVGSADAALAVLGDGAHDVLLSDVEMPDRDGYDLVAKALELARVRGLRLTAIAVTAYARAEDRMRAIEAGFHWHLSKPVEPAELVAIIASLRAQALN